MARRDDPLRNEAPVSRPTHRNQRNQGSLMDNNAKGGTPAIPIATDAEIRSAAKQLGLNRAHLASSSGKSRPAGCFRPSRMAVAHGSSRDQAFISPARQLTTSASQPRHMIGTIMNTP